MKEEAKVHTASTPRQVAEAWFTNLEQGNLKDAQALLDANVL
jgi:hypothetical protein